MNYTYQELAKMIDHSLLNPRLTEEQLIEGIEVALAYDAASVCIMPFYLKRTADLLKETGVRASTTIGFPHGVHTTETKVNEAVQAVQDGALELDMVVNISKVLSGDWDYVKTDIAAVVSQAHNNGAQVKVIFENCYLEDEHKIRLCEICTEAKADWVKTSTGYGTGGAILEDLRLMRKYAGEEVQVKAAGGVRTLDSLIAVKEAGCTRAGATATAAILDEARKILELPAITL